MNRRIHPTSAKKSKNYWPPDEKFKPLELVVPCRTGKAGIVPIYGVIASDAHVFAKWWECPWCHQSFHSRIAALKHMGLISNVKFSCNAR